MIEFNILLLDSQEVYRKEHHSCADPAGFERS